MPFGPRLDRPSAIGTEGRPRATSMTVASLAAVALAVGYAWRLDLLEFVLPVGTLAATVTVGLALLQRDRLTATLLGHLCYLPAGAALVTVLAPLSVVQPPYAVLGTGFVLAAVGLGATWGDAADAGAAKSALVQGGGAYVSMLAWYAIVFVGAGVALLALEAVAGPRRGAAALTTFLVLVAAASAMVGISLQLLPLRQLAPRSRRPAVEAAASRGRRWSLTAFVGSAVAATALGAGAGSGALPATPWPDALGLLVARPVVVAVLAVGLVPFLLGLAAAFVRRVAAPAGTQSTDRLAFVLAGLAYALVLVPFIFRLVPLPGGLGLVVAVAGAVLGPIALSLAVGLLLAVDAVALLPDRAGGLALAAAGLALATVGAALVGLSGPAVFAGALVTVLVWDAGSFGLGLTAEVGHVPETRRVELFHVILSLAVGAGALVLAGGVDLVRSTAAAGVVAVGAAVLAVVAAGLALVPVRA